MIEYDLQSSNKIIADFRSIPFFEAVYELNRIGMMGECKIREYQLGELIFKEGNHDRCIFCLLYGHVKLKKKDILVGSITHPGDIFGEMAAIDNFPRLVTARTGGKTVCALIDISCLDAINGQSNLISWHGIAKILATKLRKTAENYILAQEMISLLDCELKRERASAK